VVSPGEATGTIQALPHGLANCQESGSPGACFQCSERLPGKIRPGESISVYRDWKERPDQRDNRGKAPGKKKGSRQGQGKGK